MKKLTVSLFIVLFFCALLSQVSPLDTLSNKAKKEAMIQKQFEATYQLLLDSSFVFETDFIYSQRVNYLLNFIKVVSSKAIIQVTPIHQGEGENGFGGVTAKGVISKYKLSKNDKQNYCVLTFSFRSTYNGNFDVSLNVYETGAASGFVSFGSGAGKELFLDGHIVKTNVSMVVEGSSR
jgi:hypothetical protein